MTGEWYEYAVSRLRSYSSTDPRTKEEVLTSAQVKHVLGVCLKLNPGMQQTVIQELIASGQLRQVHQRQYQILRK